MSCFDIEIATTIDATPDRVWAHLVDELSGRRAWWIPTHTFRPLDGRVDEVGGRWLTTVHVASHTRLGPRLNFVACTRRVKAGHRLEAEYVSGCFRGVVCFFLTRHADHQTNLAMIWSAEPYGWTRRLPPAVDIGREHTIATNAAFTRLAELVRFESTNSTARPHHQTRSDEYCPSGHGFVELAI
jgi:uncharacterized protein YndB with AHSA1/START domain